MRSILALFLGLSIVVGAPIPITKRGALVTNITSPPMPPPLLKALRVTSSTTNTASVTWTYQMDPTVGFKVYNGADSGLYSAVTDAGTNLSARVPAPAPTNYYAVKAYSTNGTESVFSTEAVFVPVATLASLYVQTNSSIIGGQWGLVSTNPVFSIKNPPSTIFYRLLIKTAPP